MKTWLITKEEIHTRALDIFQDTAWPEIADMNDLYSVIRVIKKLYRMSMENFQQSLTLLCGSLLATFVDV